MLQDTDGDGVFETSTVYVDNLPAPSAVACYDGGLFIGTMPDLIYLKKTGTNNSAEERTVLFSGFGGTNSGAGAARLNNLNWGLDNRIHGVTGAAAGGCVWREGVRQAPPPRWRGLKLPWTCARTRFPPKPARLVPA